MLSDEIDKNFHIFLPTNSINKKTSTKVLFDILKINGLSYKNSGSVMLIYKTPQMKPIQTKPKKYLYIIKYKYLSSEDIKSLLSTFSDIQFNIFNNRIVFRSSKSDYKKIKQMIQTLDNSYQQKQVHFIVVSTQNSKLSKIGANYQIQKEFPDAKAYISLLTSSISFNSNVPNIYEFYSFINLLNNKGYSTIVTNPTINLIDQHDYVIESTTTLPFLVTTTTTKDAQNVTQTSYDYKDVGLKLYIKNVDIIDDKISFDLDINVQSILEKSVTPIVTNKHLQTHVTLENNQSIMIGGINSNESYETIQTIPFIENIPILNDLTKFRSNQNKNVTFSILISVN
ncbi:general secretion pathway protein D [Nitratiruptor sp. YY08-14]|nr:general secretion pathway protein D [Nitratiruptor sp. YY08-14]BCD64472.1 general secretion pathway protein D [Nitratiruptor sp. YY08-14]